MAGQFDVSGRLTEGQPAVDTLATYVSACAALGFEHPDLTAHAGQVRGWYGAEAGLDLYVLDDDCARLRAAVAAVEQACALQDVQTGALAGSWDGLGAESAHRFLARHGDASATAAAAVRAAAESLAELRATLWRAVDAKVTATLAIADRPRDESAEWHAAAETVLSGAGDRVTASELIDLRVTPFVTEDVGSDWVAAMRAGSAEVAAGYEAAIAELSAEPVAAFDVPADWAPTIATTTPAGVSAAAAETVAPAGEPSDASPAWGAPSAWSPPAAGGVPWSAPPRMPAAVPTTLADPTTLAEPPTAPAPAIDPAGVAPASTSTPATGGLPDVGSGFSGMGQQFADMLGGLLGSSGDALSGLGDTEPTDVDDELDGRESTGDEPEVVSENGEDPDSGGGTVNAAGGGGTPVNAGSAGSEADAAPVQDCPAPPESAAPAEPAVAESPAQSPGESPPAPLPTPPPGESPPAPPPTPPPADALAAEAPSPEHAPADEAATPCEIAADEVPQAGE